MKNILLLLIIMVMSLSVSAQSEDEMKAWEAYATPSATHQFLSKYDGKWKTTITMYIQAPEVEPLISTGTSTTEMVFGGRYQVTEMTGEIGGMMSNGLSTLAYDNAKKEFINTWIDDSGTGMMIMYGIWHDDEMKQIDFEGNMVNPSTGEEIFVREEFKFLDADTQSMTMWYDYGDGEHKSMELLFERIKK